MWWVRKPIKIDHRECPPPPLQIVQSDAMHTSTTLSLDGIRRAHAGLCCMCEVSPHSFSSPTPVSQQSFLPSSLIQLPHLILAPLPSSLCPKTPLSAHSILLFVCPRFLGNMCHTQPRSCPNICCSRHLEPRSAWCALWCTCSPPHAHRRKFSHIIVGLPEALPGVTQFSSS